MTRASSSVTVFSSAFSSVSSASLAFSFAMAGPATTANSNCGGTALRQRRSVASDGASFMFAASAPRTSRRSKRFAYAADLAFEVLRADVQPGRHGRDVSRPAHVECRHLTAEVRTTASGAIAGTRPGCRRGAARRRRAPLRSHGVGRAGSRRARRRTGDTRGGAQNTGRIGAPDTCASFSGPSGIFVRSPRRSTSRVRIPGATRSSWSATTPPVRRCRSRGSDASGSSPACTMVTPARFRASSCSARAPSSASACMTNIIFRPWLRATTGPTVSHPAVCAVTMMMPLP